MRLRSSKSIEVLAIVVCALVMSGLATVGNLNATDDQQMRALSQREVPKDRPGTPARPVPGALPTAPVVFNSFTSIQANVDGVGANIPGDAANEPSIAVDPNHPNRMAIGWRQFDTVASDFRQAGWAYSRDGGRTWTFPGVLDPGVFRSDPVLECDGAGNFYFMSLHFDGNEFTNQIFRSLNQGITWGPSVDAWGGDKEWIAIDRTGGMGDGHIYSSWDFATPYAPGAFTRSTDGGASFEAPLPLPGTPAFGTLAVAPDGTLYIGGFDWTTGYSTFTVAKSVNAKDASQTPVFTSAVVDLGGAIVNFPGGATPNPGGLLGQVYVDVDPLLGKVLLLCSVDPPGPDPLDVHLTRSTDGGLTWSPPIRINTDPLDPDSWQWFGAMSVAPNGRIDVIWNDTRGSGGPNISELYYTYSTDGGATWVVEVPISPAWDSWIGWPNQDKIGDYYDMVSDNVGAHVAWAATFNGEQDVYYMRIGDYDCNSNGIPDTADIANGTSQDTNINGIPDECEAAGDPPVALCQDVTVFADVTCTADASIDNGSFDPDGGPVTLDQNPTGPYPIGATAVTLIVTDAEGDVDQCTGVVTVLDTVPPEIMVTVDRDVLWPPNHKMADVSATVSVSDDCCAVVDYELVSVTSDEPDNGKGDGDTVDDIVIVSDHHFQLRSERSGKGDGRVYTITYLATDCSGNVTVGAAEVRVPHTHAGWAMASAGYSADGTGFDALADQFVLVVRSLAEQFEIDDNGQPVLVQEAFDATTLDVAKTYVGNVKGVVVPEQSLTIDNNADGLRDLALYYSTKDVTALIEASMPLSEGRIRVDESYGPIGLQYAGGNGVDYLVSGIFELGVPVPLVPSIGIRRTGDDQHGNRDDVAPDVTALHSAYPNPFNPSTTIPFELAGAEHVTLRIYTTGGALVRTLFDEMLPGGAHRAVWDGRDQRGEPAATGVYFVRLQAGIYKATRKVVMIR